MARSDPRLLNSFGTVLFDRREAVGMTQMELAARAGLTNAFISRLEHGQSSPSLTTIVELAKALGTTGADLVAETEHRT